MPEYVKARSGPKKSVIYTDSTGKQWQFTGGARPWRNNNPGDLSAGSFAKRHGSIGSAGGFAIFPNYEVGHTALLDLLKNKYKNSDIRHLMKHYAPPHQNNTKAYISFIQKRTGVFDNKKIKDFTPDEFKKLWQAIEQMEGWRRKGTIKPYKVPVHVISVRKNKKGIIEGYKISGLGWVSKSEGIEMALDGRLDAVVAHSRNGRPFLRSRPDNSIADNFDNMA